MINFLKNRTNVVVNSAKITLKLGVILALILILLIPQAMIKDLVRERQGRQTQATARIADKIGGYIDVTGPILSVPYNSTYEVTKVNPVTNAETKEITNVTRYAYFTADQIDINSTSRVENKEKSIYKIPYFESSNEIKASFSPVDFSKWEEISEGDIQFEKAMLLVGINDLKSVLISPSLSLGWSIY